MVLLVLAFTSCSASIAEEKATTELEINHHHSHDQGPVEMDADLPIFEPSLLTFTNTAEFVNSENIFVRHNTPLSNKDEVIKFYRETLPLKGWVINEETSTELKIAVQKEDRFATVRIFEMDYHDSTDLAFSINLVKPKSAVKH